MKASIAKQISAVSSYAPLAVSAHAKELVRLQGESAYMARHFGLESSQYEASEDAFRKLPSMEAAFPALGSLGRKVWEAAYSDQHDQPS